MPFGNPVGVEHERVPGLQQQPFGPGPPVLEQAERPYQLLPFGESLGGIPLGEDGLPLPESPDKTPPSCQYLVCVAERDLTTLLPLLPALAAGHGRPIHAAAE